MKKQKLMAMLLAFAMLFSLAAPMSVAAGEEDGSTPAANFVVTGSTVTAEAGEGNTADVDFTFKGETTLTSLRAEISSEPFEIVKVESKFEYEYNSDERLIIVYSTDGFEGEDVLFTVTYDLNVDVAAAERDNNVAISFIDATDGDGDTVEAVLNPGTITLSNVCKTGDVSMDGEVSNADVVMLARYLVHLTVFNDRQVELADFNKDGTVNNSDLVALARWIVEGGEDEDGIELHDFKASVFDIYIETQEMVLFTVNVEYSGEVAPIIALEENGTILTTMNDDGANGDEVPGDGVFSTEIELSKPAIEVVNYNASSGFIKSNIFEICYYRDLTQNELASFATLLDKINDLPYEEAKQFIISSEEITDYSIEEANKTIYYKSIYGISGIWEEMSEENKGSGEFAVPSTDRVNYNIAMEKANSANINPCIQNKDIIVLRPFRNSQFKYDDFLQAGTILQMSLGGRLRLRDDESVTLDVMKSLDEYGIVLIDSHGGKTDWFEKTYIVTGESFDENKFLWDPIYYLGHVGYSADYLADRIFGTSRNRAGVSSAFFDKYYSDNSLDGSFWFLGCCYSMYNDSLGNVLTKKRCRSNCRFY